MCFVLFWSICCISLPSLTPPSPDFVHKQMAVSGTLYKVALTLSKYHFSMISSPLTVSIHCHPLCLFPKPSLYLVSVFLPHFMLSTFVNCVLIQYYITLENQNKLFSAYHLVWLDAWGIQAKQWEQTSMESVVT